VSAALDAVVPVDERRVRRDAVCEQQKEEERKKKAARRRR